MTIRDHSTPYNMTAGLGIANYPITVTGRQQRDQVDFRTYYGPLSTPPFGPQPSCSEWDLAAQLNIASMLRRVR